MNSRVGMKWALAILLTAVLIGGLSSGAVRTAYAEDAGTAAAAPEPDAGNRGEISAFRADLLDQIAAAEKLIPKYYREYCTDDAVAKIEAAHALAAAGLDTLTDQELSAYLAALRQAAASLRYKSYGTLDQFFITTDKGGGESYGPTLTRPEGYVSASVVLTDKNGICLLSDADAHVKVRGSLSSLGAKKPYTIKFSAKKDLFGFGKAKKWILVADYYDPTLMRNHQAQDLAQKIGLSPVMDHRRAEVWVDGQYQGLYLLIEKIEANKNRVDIDPGSGDFLLELEDPSRTEEGKVYFQTKIGYYFKLKEPEEEDCTDELVKAIRNVMNGIELIIYYGKEDQLSQTIDVPSFVDYYLLNEFMQTSDFKHVSVFFYYDADEKKLYAGPPWDFDLAGNDHINTAESPRQIWAAKSHFYKRLTARLPFMILVKQRWEETKEIYRNSFAEGGWFEEQFSAYGDAVARDVEKWGVVGGLKMPPWGDYDTVISDYRSWLAERYDWMSEYLNDATTGIFKEDGVPVYYVSGQKTPGAGLIEWHHEYYNVGEDGRAATGEAYVTDIHAERPDGQGPFPAGTYVFDEEGRMIVPLQYEVITEVPEAAPTCTEDGVRRHWTIQRTGRSYDSADCAREAAPESLVLPATGHHYVETVIDATPETPAHTVRICTVCGYSEPVETEQTPGADQPD